MTALTRNSKKSRLALWLGASLPLVTLALGLRFFWVQPGEHIRPMGWTALLALLSGLGFMFVLPCAMHAYYFERRAIPALLAVILSLTPLPLGRWLLHFASHIVGFTVAQ